MFNTIDIQTLEGHTSSILIGDALCELANRVPKCNVIVITDKNLYHHYSSFLENYSTIIIEPGEKYKTIFTLELIYRELINKKADRNSFLLGFGGGIVCDITGFVASTFMRGVSFGFVSTSLLSQVDASIGGKNGVNFDGYKNMIGTFNQPKFVICDQSFFNTLPKQDYIHGFAEIIKTAVIKDYVLFEYLEQHVQSVLQYNKVCLHHITYQTILIKQDIVSKDEMDKGIRKILNFGHTFAHGIEKIAPQYSHGEAVALGMVMACKLSEHLCGLKYSIIQRIISLIKAFGLPTIHNLKVEDLCLALMKDKKKDGDEIQFVLLEDIGKTSIVKISPQFIQQSLS